MVTNFLQKKLENELKSAELRDIVFPDCCMNCSFSDEFGEYCNKFKIAVNSFKICNFHAEIA